MTQPAPQSNGELTADALAKDADTIDGSGSRFTPRAVILAILWLLGTVIGVLLIVQLFAAERTPALDEARLEAAEQLWRRNGPANYDMDLEIGGAQPGVVHVEVRGGRAVAMTRDGRSPAARTWEVWTVPGQFDTLERELELAEDPEHEMQAGANTRLELRCAFDAHYGYPQRYQRVVYGSGPQVNWHVTSFKAR